MTNLRGFLIGLGVALVALILLNQITSRKRLETVQGGGFVELVPNDFDSAAVDKVVAYLGSSPDSTLELERSGDGWVVPTAWGWPARQTLVDRLFTDIAELRAEVRTSSADVLGDYEIGDDEALHVIGKGSGGSDVFHVLAGKNAERGGSFVRRAGSNDVAMTKKTLRSHFGIWSQPKAPEARRWLDLQVHRVDRNDVDRIALTMPDGEIVLEKAFEAPAAAEDDTTGAPPPPPDRTSWTWKPDGAGGFDKQKTDAVLSLLAGLNATDVADPDSVVAYGLEPPARLAEITLQDGSVTRIGFGHVVPTDSTRVYLRVEGGKPAVIVKNTADRVFPAREELTPEDES